MNHNVLNSFSLVGNIAKVNDEMENSNGTKFKYFTIAQNNKYKNKNGELVDQANFFDIKIFESNYKDFKDLEVGKYIHVMGKIDVYKNKDNKTVMTLIGNSSRSLTREKVDSEIFDYDWLNEGDDREVENGI